MPSAPTAEIPHTLHVYSGYPGYDAIIGGLPNTSLSAGHVSSSGTPETHGLSTTVGVQLSPAGMYSHPVTGVAAHSLHPGLEVFVVPVPVVEVSVVLVRVVEVKDAVGVIDTLSVVMVLSEADETVVELLVVVDLLDSVVPVTLVVVSEVSEREVAVGESDETEVAVEEVREEVWVEEELIVVVVRVVELTVPEVTLVEVPVPEVTVVEERVVEEV